MFGVRTLNCCGWRELTEVRNYKRGEATIRTLLQDLVNGGVLDLGYERLRTGALLFSQAGSRSAYGRRLAELIAKHDVGKVTPLETFVNPNTKNVIQTYMWIPDAQKVIALAKELKIHRTW